MTKIVNLTQHNATPAQIADGVFELAAEQKALITPLLNFNTIEDCQQVEQRAASIAAIAVLSGADSAMIGGAPYLMPALAAALKKVNITPVFSFTLRESVDKVNEDGSVTKVAVFNHKGFVKA